MGVMNNKKILSVSKGLLKKMIRGTGKAKSKLYHQPWDKLGPDVKKGYERMARESGTDSLVMSAPQWVLPKKMSKKFENWTAKHVSIPITKTDTALGNIAGKVTGSKNLFKIKEKVPVGPSFVGRRMRDAGKKNMWQKTNPLKPLGKAKDQMYKEVNRPSITAPVTKTMGVVVPFAGAYTIDKKLGDFMDKQKQQQKTACETNLVKLEKTAAVKLAKELIRLQGEASKLAQANTSHGKRAKAEKLVYKQASMGLTEYPKSYQELQEKVASLENQDLEVLEKALELRVGDVSIGQLSSSESTNVPTTPESQFAAQLMDDDLLY